MNNTVAIDSLRDNFPEREIRPIQDEALQMIASHPEGALLEMPTGSGKTAIGMAALRAAARAKKQGMTAYLTPTKTLVDQVCRMFPTQTISVLGRSEYPCLYYEQKGIPNVNAQESPCYMLKCAHRVNQETGKTEEESANPCPYFHAKFLARQGARDGKVVVCTTAFFLANRLLVPEWRDAEPTMVVVDEVHGIADIARQLFEYTMTDYHLDRTARIVETIDAEQAKLIRAFRNAFMRIARKRPSQAPSLLKDEEIQSLIGKLEELDTTRLEAKIHEALRDGRIDPLAEKYELKLLENLLKNIPRFCRSLRYAMEEEGRRPLNYVVAFHYQRGDPAFADSKKRVRFYLTIKGYYVAPIIRKALGNCVIGYSATIGDPKIFGWESGIQLPFRSFSSPFAVENTRIFVPSDVTDLSAKKRRRDDLKKTLRKIAESATRFAQAGHRSLVVVISEEERLKFLEIAKVAGLDAVSYGNGMRARDAAAAFTAGTGQVLVGTAAQYAEGIDLPNGIAPVIFFLRPGYQRPDDPQTQFEERRFSEGHCWALWNWRVMMEALQVRGRNIREAGDKGVCFFMSQQFRRFLFSALPEWLQPAYRRDVATAKAVEEVLKLL